MFGLRVFKKPAVCLTLAFCSLLLVKVMWSSLLEPVMPSLWLDADTGHLYHAHTDFQNFDVDKTSQDSLEIYKIQTKSQPLNQLSKLLNVFVAIRFGWEFVLMGVGVCPYGSGSLSLWEWEFVLMRVGVCPYGGGSLSLWGWEFVLMRVGVCPYGSGSLSLWGWEFVLMGVGVCPYGSGTVSTGSG
ncbi:hypothetical protein Btru_060330 [Bulinus truncatus]|nr:hypothetical protein Btru_060330 [Bulinus truncatus]